MQKDIQLKVFFLEEKIELIKKFKREKAELMNRLDDDIQSMNTQIAELQDEMLQLVKGGGA